MEDDEKKMEIIANYVDAEANDESDKELDPVALNKAFKFAVRSSVLLVSVPKTTTSGVG
jgi:hypothetical protein